jgi:site-specific DNA-cytosine methylase
MLKMLDLFSGIGGFSLGCEATKGFETIAFCEIDPFCRKVLAKHWPDVPIFEDIKQLDRQKLDSLGKIDVICGGFPCQPVSCAGKRKGDKDERWLWPEFYRIVCEVRPKWVLVENVPGLLSADSGRLFAGILRDLASSGYDAEWNIVSAASVGAPHLRRRVFIVAHAQQQIDRCKIVCGEIDGQDTTRPASGIGGSGDGDGKANVAYSESEQDKRGMLGRIRGKSGAGGEKSNVANPNQGHGPSWRFGDKGISEESGIGEGIELGAGGKGSNVSNPNKERWNGRTGMFWQGGRAEPENGGQDATNSSERRLQRGNGAGQERAWRPIFTRGRIGSGRDEIGDQLHGPIISRLGGASNGLPEGIYGSWRDGWEEGTPRIAKGQKDRVSRLRALGNAIVPQCATYIGECVLNYEKTLNSYESNI